MSESINSKIELDERMTDETREYISNYLKEISPLDLIKMDVKTIRDLELTGALEANASLKFDDLSESEFHVKNPNDNFEIPVSVYTPRLVKENSPITVYIHSGGWTIGSRKTQYFSVAKLAMATNTTWLSIEYRLSPEFKYPTPLDDCKYVLDWVIKNKTKFSSENAKLGICGDSSGGHFAAILAHEYKNQIDYQILIYPIVHAGFIYDSYKEFNRECFIYLPEILEFFLRNYLTDLKLIETARMSPILNEDFTNLSKCLIIAAELDPMVGDSIAYYEKLKENKIDCTLEIVKGVHHAFFDMPVLMKNAFGQLQNSIEEFFKKI